MHGVGGRIEGNLGVAVAAVDDADVGGGGHDLDVHVEVHVERHVLLNRLRGRRKPRVLDEGTPIEGAVPDVDPGVIVGVVAFVTV
jgi:hypothetical protein